MNNLALETGIIFERLIVKWIPICYFSSSCLGYFIKWNIQLESTKENMKLQTVTLKAFKQRQQLEILLEYS